jgi:hypothetical protein
VRLQEKLGRWRARRLRALEPLAIDTVKGGSLSAEKLSVKFADEVGHAVAKRLSRKEEIYLRLTHGVKDLAHILKDVGRKLETQNLRNMEILEKLESMPETLGSIPRSAERTRETLEELQKDFRRQREANRQMAGNMRTLPDILHVLQGGGKAREEIMRAISREMRIQGEQRLLLAMGMRHMGQGLQNAHETAIEQNELTKNILNTAAQSQSVLKKIETGLGEAVIHSRDAVTTALEHSEKAWTKRFLRCVAAVFVLCAVTLASSLFVAARTADRFASSLKRLAAPAATTTSNVPKKGAPDSSERSAVPGPGKRLELAELRKSAK